MLLIAMVAALVGVARAAPAAAATDCVGVVVDARLLGGPLRTGCALGDPPTGLAALTRAGFRYTPRPRDGLVCQVDAQPASCTTTTSSRYWSYWYREPGSRSWVYANQGAGTHNPKPGSSEAWVWQDGGRRQPPAITLATICPQAASPAPKPTKTRSSPPEPTPSKTRTSRPTRTAGPATSRPPEPTASTGARPGATASDGAAPSDRATASAATTRSSRPSPSQEASDAPAGSPSATPDGTTAAAATSTPEPDPAEGDSLLKVLGAALGGLLAAGIGVAAYVRSRRGSP